MRYLQSVLFVQLGGGDVERVSAATEQLILKSCTNVSLICQSISGTV